MNETKGLLSQRRAGGLADLREETGCQPPFPAQEGPRAPLKELAARVARAEKEAWREWEDFSGHLSYKGRSLLDTVKVRRLARKNARRAMLGDVLRQVSAGEPIVLSSFAGPAVILMGGGDA